MKQEVQKVFDNFREMHNPCEKRKQEIELNYYIENANDISYKNIRNIVSADLERYENACDGMRADLELLDGLVRVLGEEIKIALSFDNNFLKVNGEIYIGSDVDMGDDENKELLKEFAELEIE